MTDLLADITTVHVVPLHGAPSHAEKAQSDAAVAVSTTVMSASTGLVQVDVQLIPVGDDATDPDPSTPTSRLRVVVAPADDAGPADDVLSAGLRWFVSTVHECGPSPLAPVTTAGDAVAVAGSRVPQRIVDDATTASDSAVWNPTCRLPPDRVTVGVEGAEGVVDDQTTRDVLVESAAMITHRHAPEAAVLVWPEVAVSVEDPDRHDADAPEPPSVSDPTPPVNADARSEADSLWMRVAGPHGPAPIAEVDRARQSRSPGGTVERDAPVVDPEIVIDSVLPWHLISRPVAVAGSGFVQIAA